MERTTRGAALLQFVGSLDWLEYVVEVRPGRVRSRVSEEDDLVSNYFSPRVQEFAVVHFFNPQTLPMQFRCLQIEVQAVASSEIVEMLILVHNS